MLITVLVGLLSCILGIAIGFVSRWIFAKFKLTSAEQRARRLEEEAQRDAEVKSKEIILKTREELQRERLSQENEAKEIRSELQRKENRLVQKESDLDKRAQEIDDLKLQLGEREEELNKREHESDERERDLSLELERVGQMTHDEAKARLIEDMKVKAEREGQIYLNKIEQDTRDQADKIARDIIVTSIQRVATDVVGETTVVSVNLPSDEMKGRIIGKEGRNIRTLENLTGADIIIDDTPEAAVISCFDPVRKEIARASLERLVQDGRIQPAHIEEVVNKVTKEVGRIIMDEGEKVVFDMGIHNISNELIKALGRLHFRTSYGQNVLQHSKEVAILSGMIASEVGANSEIAVRGGLLHDIGKGAETESEVNHAELGAEIARRLGESPKVVNCIQAHHGDVDPICTEAIIVQVADAISASRPGARHDSTDKYIKRLEDLENIAKSFDGIDNAFAIQAGRELRIMVNADKINDEDAKRVAKQIAERIEAEEFHHPGKIKITVIRETRAVEYVR